MRIAVIGDLYYPTAKEEFALTRKSRQLFYESFMEYFFSISADLYVSTGDLTNFGTKDELKEICSIIDQHQKPFVHVLGNRDVHAISRAEVMQITQLERFHAIYTENAVLAFVDTSQEQNYEDWGGTLDLVQQNWLESVIEESGTRPLIIFGHHPVDDPSSSPSIEKRAISADIPVWDILSKKQNAGLYVSGHNLFNSIATREQWTFLQISAAMDEQAVRVIDLSSSLISIDYIPFKDYPVKPHPLGTEADVKYAIPLSAPAQSDNKLKSK